MMRRTGVVLLVASTLTIGCEETPESSWKTMHKAACNADTSEFFSRIDKTAVLKNFLRRAETKADEEGLRGVAVQFVLRGLEDQVNTAFREWEDDVKKGEAGNWCGAEFDTAGGATGVVRWVTPSGQEKAARFSKQGDRYLMVELLVEPEI